MQHTLDRPAPLPRVVARPRTWVRGSRLATAILGLPLFLKVLVANCLIVVLGVGLGTWFTLRFVESPDNAVHWGAVALMVVVAIAGSVIINSGVLVLALQPLHSLERTVDQIAAGDLDARAQPVLFRDPEVERLGETVNSMLDVLRQHRDQLQTMSVQVLGAQEEERKRIARELHDETAQSLTTMLVRLKMLERARGDEELRTQLQELRELIVATLEGVRKLAVDLRPTTLDNLGLVPALEAYIEAWRAHGLANVEFAASGFAGRPRLEARVELVLYRVIQETLTNVAKHAEASKVQVTLRRTDGGVLAAIRDNGQGFDADAVMHSRERGLGLFGMQERLALVSGQLVLDSAPGGGTTVTARVPVADPAMPERLGAGTGAMRG